MTTVPPLRARRRLTFVPSARRSCSSISAPSGDRPGRRPPRQRRANGGRELEQAQCVADGRPALADAPTYFFMGQAEVLDQLAIALGRLERGQVFSLEVLDQRQLRGLPFLRQPNDDRNRRQPGEARRL